MGRNSTMFPILRLLTVFVLFIVFTGPTSEAVSSNQYDVLILGGGLAGITAANQLQKSNPKISILVIEAQNYIGGRLKNTELVGYTFGEGANYVHYVEKPENPIRELVKETKLNGHETTEDIAVKNANPVDFENEMKIIEEADEKIQGLNKEAMKQDEPMSETLKKHGWVVGNNIPLQRAVEWFVYDYEYTVKTDAMSTRNYFGLPQRNTIITDKRGYATILGYLMKDFNKDTVTIKQNTEVSHVNYQNDLVTVKTKNKETFTGKYALCTFSTGVLGNGLVQFEPPLPPWKMDAVKKIPMGYYTHVLVQFEESFWDNNEYIINIEKGEFGPFPAIYNLNKEDLHPGSNLLLFTAVGDQSKRIESQTEEKTIKEVQAALNGMYPTAGALVNKIKATFISAWSTNRYVQGSYSYATVGTTKGDFANLKGRVGNLFFAGDAGDEDYFGYLQGAYRTGFEQADIIAKCVTSGGTACPQYVPKVLSK